MTLYQITHKTVYRYKEKVSLGHNQAWLVPRNLPHQQCQRYDFQITPNPQVCVHQQDFFGNDLIYFSLETAHQYLEVTAKSQVQLTPREPPAPSQSLVWEDVRKLIYQESAPRFLKARQFLFASPKIKGHEELKQYALLSFPPGRPLLEGVWDLNHRIYTEFEFDPQSTTVSTPVETVLKQKRGVCQDFAHLAIGCLRSLGLAACYISGYVETLPPPGQPKLQGVDASHAWFSVFSAAQGWVEFDPTNDQIPSDRHVTLAWGRDFSDVVPLKGIIFGGGKHKLQVSVDMERQM